MQRVLGIDPGTATTGYGVVEETEAGLQALTYGTVTTTPDLPMAKRLQVIHRELTQVAKDWQADVAAVEEIFFSVNVRTAMSVGQARGVAMLAMADAGLPVSEYSPSAVKQALTGYGRADKRQMQEMVRMLLGLSEIPRPDDAADALAVAVCHIHSATLRSLKEIT
ncbi:MAG: crossover junction endodeoxyribonuclease RuvC [Anaerolineae bacterium]|jgi:crossover junction endodeoxyribonuclease RuvC